MRGARRTSPYVCAGPLGYLRRCTVDDGVLLVGDAAGTINPMTGEGLFMALRGAELAADAADRALRADATSRDALRAYERARAAAFGSTWTISRVLQWFLRHPAVMARVFRRLAASPRLASTLLGWVSDLPAA
jgi:flavin-dependent dehydrogenase